jgi:AcrR family transcriptional regulator
LDERAESRRGAGPVLEPKKQPRQRRARATVESIVEACARLMAERGYAAVTTNHIAAEAGVGIGSLYEYFHGKDAIVAIVAERLVGRVMDRLEAAVPEILAAPPELAALRWIERIHEILEAAIARTQGAAGAPPALAEAVTIQVPPDRHRGAFPASEFVCWTYMRRYCTYNTSYHGDFGLQARRQQRLQLAWAVDVNVVTTHLVLNYSVNQDPAAGIHYCWDTFPGWWRTFDISGNFGLVLIVRRSDQYTGTTNFHFSSAVY